MCGFFSDDVLHVEFFDDCVEFFLLWFADVGAVVLEDAGRAGFSEFWLECFDVFVEVDAREYCDCDECWESRAVEVRAFLYLCAECAHSVNVKGAVAAHDIDAVLCGLYAVVGGWFVL